MPFPIEALLNNTLRPQEIFIALKQGSGWRGKHKANGLGEVFQKFCRNEALPSQEKQLFSEAFTLTRGARGQKLALGSSAAIVRLGEAFRLGKIKGKVCHERAAICYALAISQAYYHEKNPEQAFQWLKQMLLYLGKEKGLRTFGLTNKPAESLQLYDDNSYLSNCWLPVCCPTWFISFYQTCESEREKYRHHKAAFKAMRKILSSLEAPSSQAGAGICAGGVTRDEFQAERAEALSKFQVSLSSGSTLTRDEALNFFRHPLQDFAQSNIVANLPRLEEDLQFNRELLRAYKKRISLFKKIDGLVDHLDRYLSEQEANVFPLLVSYYKKIDHWKLSIESDQHCPLAKDANYLEKLAFIKMRLDHVLKEMIQPISDQETTSLTLRQRLDNLLALTPKLQALEDVNSANDVAETLRQMINKEVYFISLYVNTNTDCLCGIDFDQYQDWVKEANHGHDEVEKLIQSYNEMGFPEDCHTYLKPMLTAFSSFIELKRTGAFIALSISSQRYCPWFYSYNVAQLKREVKCSRDSFVVTNALIAVYLQFNQLKEVLTTRRTEWTHPKDIKAYKSFLAEKFHLNFYDSMQQHLLKELRRLDQGKDNYIEKVFDLLKRVHSKGCDTKSFLPLLGDDLLELLRYCRSQPEGLEQLSREIGLDLENCLEAGVAQEEPTYSPSCRP
jgi:hypothetical protein